MGQAYDRPDIHNCELSGNLSELNRYQTVYVRRSSGVYQAHELNPGEAIDRILGHIARQDFEQSYEPCRETTPERTIHILPTRLYPNAIVPTGLVTEESSTRASGPVYVVSSRLLERKNRDLQLRQ